MEAYSYNPRTQNTERQENHYRSEDSLVYIQVVGLSGKQLDLSKERMSTGMEEKRERNRDLERT